MKIRKLYATFGKLHEQTLSFEDGLNVIYGQNESGKSTWSAFIRAMLYGISTREKSRIGFMADKEKFFPWSGEPMYGRMEVEWKGRSIVIERKSNKGGILQKAKMIDKITGLPIEMEEPIGETLLGMKREVFERTAFIGQARLMVDGDKEGELERRIVSIASTGEEDVSYTVVAERLEKQKRKLQYYKKGEIPELIDQRAETEQRLTTLHRDATILTEKHTQMEKLKAEKIECERQSAIWRSIHAWEQINLSKDAEDHERRLAERLNEARSRAKLGLVTVTPVLADQLEARYNHLIDLKHNYTNSMENMRQTLDALHVEQQKTERFPPLSGMTVQQAKEKVEADQTRINELYKRGTKSAQKKQSFIMIGFCFFACAIIVGILILFHFNFAFPIAVMTGLFTFGAGVIIRKQHRRRQGQMIEGEIGAILAQYHLTSESEMQDRLFSYQEQLRKIESAQKIYETADYELAQIKSACDDTEETLRQFLKSINPQAELSEAQNYIQAARACIREIAVAQAEYDAAVIRLQSVREGRNMDAFIKQAGEYSKDTPRPHYSEEDIKEKLSTISETLRALELDASAINARMRMSGEIAALEEESRELEGQIENKMHQLSAIDLALQTLEEVNGEMQRRFAPVLEKKAAEIFKTLTGGHFEIVNIQNVQMDVSVSESLAAPPRDILQLSQGTLDELYLSIRLALCQTVVEEPIPIVLDDALINFDDSRMLRALHYLKHLSVCRQIILFTCHRRESEYLKEDKQINKQTINL